LSKKIISSIEDVLLFCPVVVSIVLVCLIVGDIDCTLFVIVKRFFFGIFVVVVVAAGDFDVDANRLFEILFVLVDVLVIVRFGDGGRIVSSLTVVEVNTVNDGADDNIAKDDNGDEFELLFIVKNDDEVDVVVIDDETGLLIIKRGVGLVTIGFGFVVVVVIELVCVGNIGGVELPDDERISEIEFNRS